MARSTCFRPWASTGRPLPRRAVRDSANFFTAAAPGKPRPTRTGRLSPARSATTTRRLPSFGLESYPHVLRVVAEFRHTGSRAPAAALRAAAARRRATGLARTSRPRRVGTSAARRASPGASGPVRRSRIHFGDVVARRLPALPHLSFDRAVLGTSCALPGLLSRSSPTDRPALVRGAWLWSGPRRGLCRGSRGWLPWTVRASGCVALREVTRRSGIGEIHDTSGSV